MTDLIIHTVQQGTEEWKQIKAGKFGGTTASTFLVNGKGPGGIGDGLQSLIYRKASELVTGPDLNDKPTYAMDNGVGLEPIARRRYEDEHFAAVEEVGYIQRGEFFGVSPDGLVGTDGLIEIKCPQGPEFVRYMVTGEIQKGYVAQMQWAMFITGRTWCDFIVFHPEFAPLDLNVTRVHRDEKTIAAFTEKTRIVQSEMLRVLERVAEKETV